MPKVTAPSAPPPSTVVKTVKTEVMPPEPEKKPGVSEWFQALGPEERDEYRMYLYRVSDDIKTNDGRKLLQVLKPDDLAELEDSNFEEGLQDWIQRHFGGSRYRLHINDRKRGNAVYKLEFTIDGEPHLSPREMWKEGAAPNTLEAAVIPYVKEALMGATKRGLDPATALDSAMGIMAKANDRALQIALAQLPKAASPAETLGAMIDALHKLGIVKGDKDDDANFLGKLEQLKNLGMIRVAGEEDQPTPKSLWDEVKSATEGLRALGISVGSKSAGDWATILASALAQNLPPVLQALTERYRAAPAPVGYLPPPVSVAAAPAGPAPPVASLPAAEPSRATAPPQDFWTFIRERLKASFLSGVEAENVADWLVITDPALADRLGSMTAGDLLTFMAGDEILKPMQYDPRLPAWLNQFLAYFKSEPQEPVAAGASEAQK